MLVVFFCKKGGFKKTFSHYNQKTITASFTSQIERKKENVQAAAYSHFEQTTLK